jgi:hypothetical protein
MGNDKLVNVIFRSLGEYPEHPAHKLAAIIRAGRIARAFADEPKELKKEVFSFYGASEPNCELPVGCSRSPLARSRLRHTRRYRQSRLSRFPHIMERRRSDISILIAARAEYAKLK